MGLSLVVVLVPLLLVLGSVIQKGASVISWSFLTDDIPPVRRQGPGMGPAVVGTIVITATAAAMAIPLGILGAVYLHEYGKTGRLAQVLRFFADVMTGVPSIIMGLFIYTIWVVRFGVERGHRIRRCARPCLSDAADHHPLDRGDAEARARRST